jgi:23S rRNA (pseudouridine1915-N3)-methyltransferase
MNILIAAIGKYKSGPERALFEHYSARCAWKITLKEWESKKNLPPAARQAEEGAWLLAACKDAEHLIALDEGGKELSSTEFATHLCKQRDNSVRNIAFIIGGADGLHDNVLKKANLTLSLGRVTWPHLLVRGLLAEQLYRAQSILSGHPYHRE